MRYVMYASFREDILNAKKSPLNNYKSVPAGIIPAGELICKFIKELKWNIKK